MKRLFAVMSLVAMVVATVLAAPKKVACIGNSITYGLAVDNREANCYPAQLQRLLGDGYEVGNFGKSGATLLRKGHRPYNEQSEYAAALAFCPDIAVIHLGINDTDPRDWPDFNSEFVGDYLKLIDTLRVVNPQVRIIMARLTPLSAKHFRFKSGTRDWRLQIQQALDAVAAAAGVEMIDFDTPLRDRQNLLADGIHPNAAGAGVLAQTVYSGITGDYGGLQLPEVYQSGMVLQRNQPLRIAGRADAGSKIVVTLDNRRYHAVADNRGRWHVLTAPLVAGTGYELSVTDGSGTIRLTDIMAGEVWLASGQSNMEFTLGASKGGAEAVAASADPELRIFDMKPVARTDNAAWPDSVLDAVNNLQYFKPAKWQAISPGNARSFSAVAYHFAKQLRDSLDVPVGVICNAVGGAPAEAWIDVNYLERDIPEILLDWLGNDYVQKWVQGRARTNIGAEHKTYRHPYEPSYLFSAGVRPLAGFRIAGVIWYQGESNAHNIEVHERLFPLLIESWRNNFDNQSMPFYFVQLSSLNRPSWPQFRDSQRRMAERLPYTGMAVSSDSGDSLDVHPTNKRPVGERLARQALKRTYNRMSLSADGPRPVSAMACQGAIRIVMSDADGLHTSDGLAPATFEIAEIDGVYKPALAEIVGNEIKVYNMDIKKPRFVRYGWQPYTRANLVNADNLPASTFKMEVDNTSVYDHEAGIEAGVSACFATMLNNRLVMAGGCNFPTDPMAAGSRKKFYKGVYAAACDGSELKWEKIGELPEAIAYGATATTKLGAVLIGGTTAEKSLDRVWLLRVDSGLVPSIEPLPSLPVAVDNMAAYAIGNKVYVAGGNADGVPSTQLLVLDLDAANPEWRKLRSMPGNPRVQPAMAAGDDAKGETCLYLWGGFAGKGEGREASLETAGLKYIPSKNKWVAIDAPTDRSGDPVSVGGGAACTLTDGRIAVAGGVNKDIFLEALRNQAPDYLQHSIEWYRFNPNILLFSPATEQWQVEEVTADAARAGAAIVAGSDHDFYLIGGELKPRIRTAETLHVTEIRHH